MQWKAAPGLLWVSYYPCRPWSTDFADILDKSRRCVTALILYCNNGVVICNASGVAIHLDG